ncbi:unnamed protein product [Caenorhabditis auriculariae]|uniref:Peptidase M12B domain-containing protein n=1 Tax=Caenorhabditis auriculariae TaxID=2777116 RepID=A0A8S1HCP9_9PELO|nr:unnamed protein product [Caenorhabditis auriculariae]
MYLEWIFIVAAMMALTEVAGFEVGSGSAVWGARAPHYSKSTLPRQTSVFIRNLVFVDNKTTKYYDFDMIRVKENVMKVIDEANLYLNQLSVGIIVVDIYQTMREDLSLQSFSEYRDQRRHKLPPHDFATLMSFKYPGGLAYVDAMCTSQSVSLCGFYPQEPRAMGAIYFHEIAHLVGVPHLPDNETLYVSNCKCANSDENDGKTKKECLKIPGFTHECTAQHFVNVIYKKKCLSTYPLFTRSEPLCGNSVVEDGEQCDCGIPSRCLDFNCQPYTCRYRMHPAFLIFLLVSAICTFVCCFFLVTYRYGACKMLGCFENFKRLQRRRRQNSSPYGTGQITMLAASPYQHRKLASPNSSEGSTSVLVINESQCMTLQRPKVPPPPPPVRATIRVDASNVFDTSRNTEDPDDISWKFRDFSDDETEEVEDSARFSSYPLPPGVATCPSYPTRAPINRVTVDLHNDRSENGTTTTSSC